MPKISKSSVKKTNSKVKKTSNKVKKVAPKVKKAIPKTKNLISNEKKTTTIIKVSKTYVPKDTEKYMCEKHKIFFKIKLQEWKKELVKANNEALYNGSIDDNSVSADIVDQASSYTDKTVEMKALNRSRKLISKINSALQRLKEGTYGFCEETGEPIGLKRLMARPIATLSIEAQEKHERDEKIFVDD